MGTSTPRLWTDDFYRAVNPAVNVAGFSRAEPGYFWRSSRPVNPDFDLWCVEAGRGEVLLDGRWHEASAGDVLAIKPGQRYEKERVASGEGGPWQMYFFHFWPFGNAASAFNKPLARRLPTKMRFDTMPRLRDFFCQMFEAWTLRREGYLMEAKASAIRVLETVFAALRGEPPSGPPAAYARVVRAHDHLVSHLQTDLSVDELAEHADLSASYLLGLFRRHYGCSPVQYRIDLRLRSARLRLARGERVTDVAEGVGFHSLHYFSRLFRRRLGLSPTEFVRQCRRK